MTPQEAKTLLQKDLDDPGSVDIADLNQAQQLGIEAIDRILYFRGHPISITNTALPSETNG